MKKNKTKTEAVRAMAVIDLNSHFIFKFLNKKTRTALMKRTTTATPTLNLIKSIDKKRSPV